MIYTYLRIDQQAKGLTHKQCILVQAHTRTLMKPYTWEQAFKLTKRFNLDIHTLIHTSKQTILNDCTLHNQAQVHERVLLLHMQIVTHAFNYKYTNDVD